jgi:hypothetical protein
MISLFEGGELAMKREIDLPFSKNWMVEGPRIKIVPGQVIIRYDYVPGVGESHWVTIKFTRVIAYKYMDETCCTAPVDIISDGLVEFDLDDSLWLCELKGSRDRFFVEGSVMHEKYGRFDFRHYGLWFGEEGCFEVIARSYEIETD